MMSKSDKELKQLISKACQSEATPGFDEIWHKAEQQVAEVSAPPSLNESWRWALGPAAVLGTAAVVALVVAVTINQTQAIDGTGNGTGVARVAPAVADLQGIEPWSGVLDNVGIGWEEVPLPSDQLLVALGETAGESEGSALLATPTDFLLELEFPAWNGAGERNKR
jgi:hypothetical protein